MTKILLRDLTPGSSYAVQLRTVTEEAVSEWSRKFSVTTNSDVTPPDVPQWTSPEASAWVVDGDTFVGTWQALDFNLEQNSDFSRYELILSDGVKTVTVSTTNTIYVLSFEQNRAFFGTPKATVTAKVRSVDATGNVSATNTELSATNPAPAAVTNLVATPQLNSIALSWDASPEADFHHYLVQVSTTGVGGTYSNIYSGPNNSFTHQTTMFATDHYYKVFAYDKFNSASPATTSGAVRPNTTFGSDTTAPPNATSFNITTAFDAGRQESVINATWTASTNPDGDLSKYVIRYSPTGSGEWRYVTLSSDTVAATIGGLLADQNYYVQIRTEDFAGNESGWLNANNYPLLSAKDSVAPSQPVAPTCVVGVNRLQVTAIGTKQAGGAMEPDVAYYSVYASTTSGFTAAAANKVGEIAVGPAMVGTFQIPASSSTPSATSETWYVRVAAVDRSGNEGSASNQATAAVGLIATANIIDAAITNAKISDLAVDKLTAGTGLATDFTIKSTLTLGESGNDGVIRSYDYGTSGGTTGFSLDSDGLIIKTGQIEAAALRIQTGFNTAPVGFSDFQQPLSFYPDVDEWVVPNALGITAEVSTDQARFSTSSLKIVNSSGTTKTVYLSHNSTNYNVSLAPSANYIVSAYVYNGNTAQTPNWRIGFKQQDATFVYGTAVALPGAVGWNRVSWVLTTSSTTTSGLLTIESAGDSTFYIDGVQMELQISGSTSPSPWAPPSLTTIDGGAIKTGSIQSNTYAIDAAGNAMPDFPAWSINTSGDATFGNAMVLGTIIVGQDGEETTFGDDTNVSIVKSYNYVRGSSGWAIRSDGTAEFRNLEANTITAEAIEAVNPENIKGGRIAVDGDLTVSNKIIAEDVTDALDVTFKSRTSNVATLTTAQDHQINVGDRIYVEIGKGSASASTYAVASDTVTITTAAAHGFSVGDTIDGELIDTFGNVLQLKRSAIATVPNSTTFTYSDVDAENTSASDVSGEIINIDTTYSSPTVQDLFTVTSVTADTLTYANTGSNQSSTATLGFLIGHGRSVEISPQGVRLLGNDGITTIVDLPTNSTIEATFSGTISAKALTVENNLEVSGADNLLNQDSTLTLSANVPNPSVKPTHSFVYSGFKTPWSGTSYNMRGLTVTGANATTGNGGYYHTLDISESTHHYVYDSVGNYIARRQLPNAQVGGAAPPPGGGVFYRPIVYTLKRYAYGGMTKLGSFWYVLYWRDDSAIDGTVAWQVWKYDDTGPQTGPGEFVSEVFTYNDASAFGVTAQQWKYVGAGGSLYNPAIGNDGTNLVIARAGLSGVLRWTKYNTSGVKQGSTVTTNVFNKDHVASVIQTSADLGGTRVIISSWGGGGAASARHYSFNTSGTQQANETFLNAYSHQSRGLVYVGDSSSGRFVGQNGSAYVYDYTNIAKNGSASWGIKYTWEDFSNNETTGYSPVLGFTAQRRARVRVSTAGSIPPVADAARFYVSPTGVSGTFYRMTQLGATGRAQVYTSQPSSSSGSKLTAFPAGTPAKIISSNGLVELNANGTLKGSTLTLDTLINSPKGIISSNVAASTGAGNAPALRVANTAGSHLRIDGFRIIKMNDDTTQGTLEINPGGGVRIGRTATPQIAGIDFGADAITTNGSGDFTISHALGANPNMVVASLATTNVYIVSVSSWTATNWTGRVANANTGTAAASLSFNVRWIAITSTVV